MASWKELILSGSSAHLHSITASHAVPLQAPNVASTAYVKPSMSLAVFESANGNLMKGNTDFIAEILLQHTSSLSSALPRTENYRRYFLSGSANMTYDDINLSNVKSGIVDIYMSGPAMAFTTQFVDTGSMHYQSSGSTATNSGSRYTFNLINASGNTGSMFFRPGDICPASFISIPPNETISFHVWRGDYITSHKTPPFTTVRTFWMPFGQSISPY